MASFSKFLSFLVTLIIIGCTSNPLPKQSKPLILVSIAPYKFIAQKIAGSDFDVTTVVPAAANPHTFEPTTAQVTHMASAEVWFGIGEPFEKKINPILTSNNPSLISADLREGIDLIHESTSCKYCSEDHADRHIWLSPTLAKKQARIIKKILTQKYPDKKELFSKNYEIFAAEADLLEKEIREILKKADKKTLLVSHAAFAYFCHDFGLTQISVEVEGKDPRPKDLEKILKQSENYSIAIALPQHNNKGTELIAAQLGKPVRYIDPYSENYFDSMKQLAQGVACPSS